MTWEAGWRYGIISTVPYEQQKIYRQIILFLRIYYLSISLTGLPCHREPSIVLMSMITSYSARFHRDAIIISICNCLTSVYAGFAIFSILGSLAYELNVPVSEVVSSGSGLAFVAYPQAVLNIPPPQLWSILFFAMFISIGMSSQVSIQYYDNTITVI